MAFIIAIAIVNFKVRREMITMGVIVAILLGVQILIGKLILRMVVVVVMIIIITTVVVVIAIALMLMML